MKFNRRSRIEVGIDIAPLVDVVFLLLIFFAVATSFVDEARLGISLPGAAQSAKAQGDEPLTVVVTKSGAYRMAASGSRDLNATQLRGAMAALVTSHPDTPLVLVGDANAPHHAVVTVMDIARQLQITSLRIATDTTDAK